MPPPRRPGPVAAALVLLLGLAWLAAPSRPAGAAPAQEERLRKSAASRLVTLAKWCEKNGFPAEAKAHLDEALALAPEDKAAKALAARLASARGPSPASGADAAARYEAERAKAFREAGKDYLDLAALPASPSQQTARDAWLLRAVAMAPEAAAKAWADALAGARASGDADRVLRLLDGAPPGFPAEEAAAARAEAERKAAESRPVARTARGHPMRYWLGLPRGWTREKPWPLLVTVDGAGQQWEASCRRFMVERDKRSLPFVVVSLVRLNPKDYGEEVWREGMKPASRDDLFDLKGMRTVADEVAEEFAAERRFFVTGFSAGGAVTWYATIFHPEWLRASAPACGGFGLRQAPSEGLVSEAPERASLPVRVFQGVRDDLALGPLAGDAEGIRRHWQPYAETFDRQGFKDVRLVLLDEVGHSPCTPQVVEFFASVLAK